MTWWHAMSQNGYSSTSILTTSWSIYILLLDVWSQRLSVLLRKAASLHRSHIELSDIKCVGSHTHVQDAIISQKGDYCMKVTYLLLLEYLSLVDWKCSVNEKKNKNKPCSDKKNSKGKDETKLNHEKIWNNQQTRPQKEHWPSNNNNTEEQRLDQAWKY